MRPGRPAGRPALGRYAGPGWDWSSGLAGPDRARWGWRRSGSAWPGWRSCSGWRRPGAARAASTAKLPPDRRTLVRGAVARARPSARLLWGALFLQQRRLPTRCIEDPSAPACTWSSSGGGYGVVGFMVCLATAACASVRVAAQAVASKAWAGCSPQRSRSRVAASFALQTRGPLLALGRSRCGDPVVFETALRGGRTIDAPPASALMLGAGLHLRAQPCASTRRASRWAPRSRPAVQYATRCSVVGRRLHARSRTS